MSEQQTKILEAAEKVRAVYQRLVEETARWKVAQSQTLAIDDACNLLRKELELARKELELAAAHSSFLSSIGPVAQDSLRIVEAGVDPNHQTTSCDHCGVSLTPEDGIRTCDHARYLTLCQSCYDAAGNSVR